MLTIYRMIEYSMYLIGVSVLVMMLYFNQAYGDTRIQLGHGDDWTVRIKNAHPHIIESVAVVPCENIGECRYAIEVSLTPNCPSCEEMDTDGDADVDLVDFARFQQMYSGPIDWTKASDLIMIGGG